MLVVSRKTGSSVVVDSADGPIEFMILGLSRDQVRLGIVAPEQVKIHRKELLGRASEAPLRASES